ncbi:MAG: hypothetical protein U9Q83_03630 [Bacteroidota bacterium]|nr:hypothetical protein [Bacteroidota bacterium]
MATKTYKLVATEKTGNAASKTINIELELDEKLVKKCAGNREKLTSAFAGMVSPYFSHPNARDIKVTSCNPVK